MPGAAPHKVDTFHGTNSVKITVKPVVVKRQFFAQRVIEKMQE
jgi:hypothetical protein